MTILIVDFSFNVSMNRLVCKTSEPAQFPEAQDDKSLLFFCLKQSKTKKRYLIYIIQQREKQHPHIWKAETRECLAFFQKIT